MKEIMKVEKNDYYYYAWGDYYHLEIGYSVEERWYEWKNMIHTDTGYKLLLQFGKGNGEETSKAYYDALWAW